MNEKKYKRLEYLSRNIDYLTIRQRQEYNELLNEYNRTQSTSQDQFYDEGDDWQNQDVQNENQYSLSNHDNQYSRNTNYRQNERYDQEDLNGGPNPQPSKNKKSTKNKKKKKRHWFRSLLLIIILIIAVMIGFFVHGYNRGIKHEGGEIAAEKFTGSSNSDGSTNILVLGADKRPGQSEDVAHTDSIMVLHLSKDKKTVRLVSYMRDTLVKVPGVTNYGKPNVKINAAFTIGEQYSRQGVNLLSDTLKENFGVNIKYYAVVDFSSFATIIDSLFPSGVQIDAQFSTINGKKMDEVPVPDDLASTDGALPSDKTLTASQAAELGYPDGGGTFMMIKQGPQKMNGRTLLNYARFRHDDKGDFGRVARQQQVMQTIISKAKNPMSLFTGSSAIGTARAVTMTNIPNSFFLTTGLATLFGMSGGVQSTTIPSTNDWKNAYDKYGGLGLSINMSKYKALSQELLGQ